MQIQLDQKKYWSKKYISMNQKYTFQDYSEGSISNPGIILTTLMNIHEEVSVILV